MMKNKFIYLSVLAFVFAGCDPEFENELSDANYSAGDADFSSYVAIGNSLTAGYMDGTMYRTGQQYSFPNLLAQQFAVVGGGEFTQPSYEEDTENLGGISGLPGFNTRLIIDASAGGPENIAGTPSITLTPQATAYNNMGVPGAKSFHLLAPGYGNPAGLPIGAANPYFVRHATSPTATVLGDALSKNPTFFTNWIGNNDVLSYATSGGVGVNQAGNFDPSTYGSNDITDPMVFANVYSQITDALTANGAKGVVATVPDVTSIPFFTTVPYNPINAAALGGGDVELGKQQIIQLNQLIGQLKTALTAFGAGNRINLLNPDGNNPVLITDETLTNLAPQITAALTFAGFDPAVASFVGTAFGRARHANANDIVLLTTSSVIGTAPPGAPAPFNAYGVTYPLQDQHILIPTEVDMIEGATASFNTSIKAIAAAKGLAVADMNQILQKLTTGLRTEDGQVYTADYFSLNNISTVLFSLDGVHPNARGYAVIANEILKVINEHYNAKLPLVSAGNFPGATVLPSN